MAQGFIYAHIVESGIKIGWASVYKNRKKSYSSHGDIIKELRIIEVEDYSIDGILKETLIELGYQVKIPGQGSTEVYSLTVSQVDSILEYIEKNQEITKDVIRNLLKAGWQYLTGISYRTYRKLYGSKYIKFKYQRNVDLAHMNAMIPYLRGETKELLRCTSPIIAVKIKNDKYAIIDGLHRSEAIVNMPDDEKLDYNTIDIKQMNTEYTEEGCIQLFRDINKAKPMADIFVMDNYINLLITETVKLLKNTYGSHCIRDDNKNIVCSTMSVCRINEFITNDNIIKLLDSKIIKGIEYKEICEILINLNEKIYQTIHAICENNILLNQNTSVTSNKIKDSAWKEVITFIRKINEQKTYKIEPIKQTLERIRTNCFKAKYPEKKKVILKEKLPFVLGLTARKSLMYSLENIDACMLELGYGYD